DGTYKSISLHYFWENMYVDVENYVKNCEECLKMSQKRIAEPLHSNLFNHEVLHTVHVDLVKMPNGRNGENCFVNARDALTGFVDGKALKSKKSSGVAK
ncbi:hypothetical protein ROZALSC1DRAFT_16301, partial [Rozella allomycis CSF55]